MPSNAPALGSGALLFPLTQDQAAPAIGQSFDPISGTAPAVVGFDPPQDGDLNSLARVNDKSKYFLIYDASTFADATDFDLETSGGGWGASVGMSFQASSRVQSSSTTYTIHLNAAATSSQATVKSETHLSKAAAALLKSGIDKFTEKYGTHFVAGYIYGKACKLSYHMKFSALSVKEKFQASYSESTSELGFSDSLSTSLSNALSLSNTSCTVDFESNGIGFDYDPPKNIPDLATIAAAYGSAEKLSPVAIVVLPWSFLAEVSDAMGTDLAGNPDLADLVNDLVYIQASCGNFIERQLYTGNTQFQNVGAVRAKAGAEITAILGLLSAANKAGATVTASNDGTQVTVQVGKKPPQSFALAQPLQDEMNSALAHFVLSWLASYFTGASPAFTGTLTRVDGTPIVTEASAPTILDGRAGSYFTWVDNSAGWAVTKGTTQTVYNLAQRGTSSAYQEDGFYFSILLDWKAGAVQALTRYSDPAQTVTSPWIVIRGEVNTLDCETPSDYRAAADSGAAYSFHVAPI